jgi:hypothetical protein
MNTPRIQKATIHDKPFFMGCLPRLILLAESQPTASEK